MGKKLNFEEFLEELEKNCRELIPTDEQVVIQRTQDDVKNAGLQFLGEEKKGGFEATMPHIDCFQLYSEEYLRKGHTVAAIACSSYREAQIIREIESTTMDRMQDIVNNYEKAKKYLCVTLEEASEDVLKKFEEDDICFERCMDKVLIFSLKIPGEEYAFEGAIHGDMMQSWGITIAELKKVCMKNYLAETCPKLVDFKEVLAVDPSEMESAMENELTDYLGEIVEPVSPEQLLYITDKSDIANTVLVCGEVLREIAILYECDLFLIPLYENGYVVGACPTMGEPQDALALVFKIAEKFGIKEKPTKIIYFYDVAKEQLQVIGSLEGKENLGKTYNPIMVFEEQKECENIYVSKDKALEFLKKLHGTIPKEMKRFVDNLDGCKASLANWQYCINHNELYSCRGKNGKRYYVAKEMCEERQSK